MRRSLFAGSGSLPLEYAVFRLARRYGRFPWELDDAPADGVMQIFEWEELEAKAADHLAKKAAAT